MNYAMADVVKLLECVCWAKHLSIILLQYYCLKVSLDNLLWCRQFPFVLGT